MGSSASSCPGGHGRGVGLPRRGGPKGPRVSEGQEAAEASVWLDRMLRSEHYPSWRVKGPPPPW